MIMKAGKGFCVISMEEAEALLNVLRGILLTESELETVEGLQKRLMDNVATHHRTAAEVMEQPVAWEVKPFELRYRDGWIEIVQEG